MKKSVLLLLSLFFVVNISAQEWKLSPIWHDEVSSLYLSYAHSDDAGADAFFSLWGYKKYTNEDSAIFELEYFKGSPDEMHAFLKGVSDFALRNRAGMAVAIISGVKVKTFKYPMSGSYTCVYDKNGRDLFAYKAKKWAQLHDSFVGFCLKYDIELE